AGVTGDRPKVAIRRENDLPDTADAFMAPVFPKNLPVRLPADPGHIHRPLDLINGCLLVAIRLRLLVIGSFPCFERNDLVRGRQPEIDIANPLSLDPNGTAEAAADFYDAIARAFPFHDGSYPHEL